MQLQNVARLPFIHRWVAAMPDDLRPLRRAIEKTVPHGRTHHGVDRDQGLWGDPPKHVRKAWRAPEPGYREIVTKRPAVKRGRTLPHLGTLGTGNHFIEVCLDREDRVWFVWHSGSRGIGNGLGTYFMEMAKKDLGRVLGTLPDEDLAYFTEGTRLFDDYVHAVSWPRDFAGRNDQHEPSTHVRHLPECGGQRPPSRLLPESARTLPENVRRLCRRASRLP